MAYIAIMAFWISPVTVYIADIAMTNHTCNVKVKVSDGRMVAGITGEVAMCTAHYSISNFSVSSRLDLLII